LLSVSFSSSAEPPWAAMRLLAVYMGAQGAQDVIPVK
jgi:hypothetical protein